MKCLLVYTMITRLFIIDTLYKYGYGFASENQGVVKYFLRDWWIVFITNGTTKWILVQGSIIYTNLHNAE